MGFLITTPLRWGMTAVTATWTATRDYTGPKITAAWNGSSTRTKLFVGGAAVGTGLLTGSLVVVPAAVIGASVLAHFKSDIPITLQSAKLQVTQGVKTGTIKPSYTTLGIGAVATIAATILSGSLVTGGIAGVAALVIAARPSFIDTLWLDDVEGKRRLMEALLNKDFEQCNKYSKYIHRLEEGEINAKIIEITGSGLDAEAKTKLLAILVKGNLNDNSKTRILNFAISHNRPRLLTMLHQKGLSPDQEAVFVDSILRSNQLLENKIEFLSILLNGVLSEDNKQKILIFALRQNHFNFASKVLQCFREFNANRLQAAVLEAIRFNCNEDIFNLFAEHFHDDSTPETLIRFSEHACKMGYSKSLHSVLSFLRTRADLGFTKSNFKSFLELIIKSSVSKEIKESMMLEIIAYVPDEERNQGLLADLIKISFKHALNTKSNKLITSLLSNGRLALGLDVISTSEREEAMKIACLHQDQALFATFMQRHNELDEKFRSELLKICNPATHATMKSYVEALPHTSFGERAKRTLRFWQSKK